MKWTFLCMLLMLGCPYMGFSQNTTLSGHLIGIQDGKYIYLTTYILGKGDPYQDSAKVTNGSFSFHMSIPDGEGSLYYMSSVRMRFQGGNTPIDPILYSHRWHLIYLQQGKAVVDGDANFLDRATYSGDPYMRDENDYFARQRANKLWEKFQDGADEAYARVENTKGTRPLKEDSADKGMMAGMYLRIQIAEAWVKDHPNSPYSAAVVLKDITGFFGEENVREEKAKYFHLLTPAARNNKLGKFMEGWLH